HMIQYFYHLPILEALRSNGKPLISVPILDREVFAKLWELRVGRVSLYLLDTDIAENSAEDRLITAELYGGDLEMRMRQEIMLGIGGVKALAALGIQPDVFHMNEAHSAFLALRLSRHTNGVSKLHGEITRSLWKDVWSGVPVQEVPITSITNGVHTKTWMAPEFAALYRKHLGAWEEHLTEPDFWRGVIDIPDAQLWETHQQLKRRLIDFVRDRERQRRERLGESPES